MGRRQRRAVLVYRLVTRPRPQLRRRFGRIRRAQIVGTLRHPPMRLVGNRLQTFETRRPIPRER